MEQAKNGNDSLADSLRRVFTMRSESGCLHVTSTCSSFPNGRCNCICHVCIEVRLLKSGQLWPDTGFASG
jgi:hypothetical protein